MPRTVALSTVVAGLLFVPLAATAQSRTDREVEQSIGDIYEYNNANLSNRPSDYSKHGSLAFWSSGGMLQSTAATTEPGQYDAFSIQPKHITVVTLVEDQAAVALLSPRDR